MSLALEEAEKALQHNDVPVGAVIYHNPTAQVISFGHNIREKEGLVTGHAEIEALQKACEVLGGWRLSDCTLYVTLEPCPMCAGAIIAARIPRVVYGAKDPVAGAMGSIWALHTRETAQDNIKVEYGCFEKESSQLLREFFKSKR
ncbi:MAG: nucleoside deaminase [Ruminococcaceae bacterium]|nr:nucleoside deaminase [Oscillospiraceae bacterium]